MREPAYQRGDWVIYRKTKTSERPGPRADNVAPTPHGDDYVYTVDKFWVVVDVRADGTLVLQTRTGKRHVAETDDPQLRKANWLERWRYRSRFSAIAEELPERGES